MGKRVEKVFSREKGPSSTLTPLHHEDDPNRPDEPYVVTGNFSVDFSELCVRGGVGAVPVVARAHRPITPPPQPVAEEKTRGGGKKDDRRIQVVDLDPEPELTENGEPIEHPPKTYTTKEKFEYFKPCVQVETEHVDKHDYISEICVRGWKVDVAMMNILKQCCPKVDHLHTINLWNAGLSEETVEILTSFLPQCSSLKTLSLDNNPIKEPTYHVLITDSSPVLHLSLRYNRLADKAVELISLALGTTAHQNSTLLSLNLNGNWITDDGLQHLSRALRTNRTLLCLALANNRIGDRGVESLAEVISQFPLTHEEIVERRRLISERGAHDTQKSSPVNRRSDSRERPSSVRSVLASRAAKTAKGKKEGKKEDEKHDKAKGKRDAQAEKVTKKGAAVVGAAQETSANKGTAKKGEKPKGKQKGGLLHPEVENNLNYMQHVENASQRSPLLDNAQSKENGVILLSGNRTLISLNLAWNHISAGGVKALQEAVGYQTSLLNLNKSAPPGLMRLSLIRNDIASDNDDMMKLTSFLQPKDPFYQPATSSPDHDSIKA